MPINRPENDLQDDISREMGTAPALPRELLMRDTVHDIPQPFSPALGAPPIVELAQMPRGVLVLADLEELHAELVVRRAQPVEALGLLDEGVAQRGLVARLAVRDDDDV